ncbi:hypothetical protein [Microcoleus sp. bin38.metabat.b11b12b14.051]|uniref:hypothetical protein n=1 Tax=Microcoleus sp. bin38.metabat.b11b12b14.051 TaxID=2742709 RepID=UPI0025F119F2|nr:hypothetical protein [Microcoleus sp. bin38.metabat.b11b12b14.051]
MTAQNVRINVDPERTGDVIIPSVYNALIRIYGLGFCDASVNECLVILEAVALSLRVCGAFSDNLRVVVGDDMDMPCGIYISSELGQDEGLKLLAILQVAIVEHCLGTRSSEN